MRFIGNKENLVDKIYQTMSSRNIQGESFFDFFSGTVSVAKYFKKLNYQVYSSDILYFSYVLQRAYVGNNKESVFTKLLKNIDVKSDTLLPSPLMLVIDFLNQIKPIKGFIYNNYTPSGSSKLEQPRMYFTDENGAKIDAIRTQIENWKSEDLLSNDEYYTLLACLIETVPFYANIVGVYAAFQKKWDSRAKKKIVLRPIEPIINDKKNHSYNTDSATLIDKVKADIYYLDPPYNQRQYAPNYHILETIAKYDNPIIKGVTGLRNYDKQKSAFCNRENALQELSKIAKEADYKTMIMSYSSEGIMPKEDIISVLKQNGKVELVEFDYLRFKSNNNGNTKNKKHVKEQLYITTKK